MTVPRFPMPATKLHWSLIIPLGITAFRPEAFAFMLALFVFVWLHELGHAHVAQKWGIKCEKVVMSMIGGMAL